MDPRATEAATILMRQGIEVYKLKQDVTLPQGSTFRFYGPSYNAAWGVSKNRTSYIGVLTTKVPRTRVEIRNNYTVEANAISLNFTNNLAGVPWVALTDSQMPTVADAPEVGGGDWMPVLPEHIVAKTGYYVIPTAQKWARYAGFQLEPRSNCGLLFWAHWDSAVGGNGSTLAPNQFNLELTKTFDYTAIPATALERVIFTEDVNNKPASFPNNPPYNGVNTANLSDAGATVLSSTQSTTDGSVTVKIQDACLHDGMWVAFFFYDEDTDVFFPIYKQVFEVAPGTYEAVFSYMELEQAGLEPGINYAIRYSNARGDIFGYGTFNKGALAFDNPCISATPSASVAKQSGNNNTLTITVAEVYAGGETGTLIENFTVINNAAGIFAVGPYYVYVNTIGTNVHECYLVDNAIGPIVEKFTRLIRVNTANMTYSEIQNDVLGSGPIFNLTTAGNTNINANGLANRNAVEVKINGVNGKAVSISAINTAGTESVRIPMKETSAGSGIFAPTSLVNYSWNSSLLFTPIYTLRIYANNRVVGTLVVTVNSAPPVIIPTTPTLEKFIRLVRANTTASPITYTEIQNGITGLAPDFTLTTVGTTIINANSLPNRNSVEVKISGLSGQTVYIAPVNNQGTEGAKVQMKETATGSGIYTPVSLVSYSWNASLLFTPKYILRIYADNVEIGTLTVTVTP
jgi:hypothetical protein